MADKAFTSSRVLYNLDSGYSIANYSVLYFVYTENGYIKRTITIPKSAFTANSNGISEYSYTGSKNVEIDISYYNATAVYLQYATSATLTNPKMAVYGLRKTW